MDNFSDSYIKVRNLRLKYFRKSDITLNIRKGEVVALTGDSGSGKSTLLKYLGGVIRPEQNGIIKVGELDLYNEVDIAKFHRICGICFQDPLDNLIFDNLETDLRFGYENIGSSYDAEKIDALLRKNKLAGKAGISYDALSGGELRRASIVSALMYDPELILMDEALTGCDNEYRENKFTELLQSAREDGKTFIFISHNDWEIKQADRIIELRQGDVISDYSTVTASPKKSEGMTRITKYMRYDPNMSVLMRGADGKKLFIHSYVYNNNEEGSPVIRFRDVGFFYRKRKTRLHIIDGLSYDFLSGRLYVISGRSGAGKSTFLKLLNGILHAKKGNVYAFGKKLPGYGKNGWQKIKDTEHVKYLNRIRKRIGYLDQNTDNMLIEGNVLGEAMFGPLSFGMNKANATHRARVALRTMQVDESRWKDSPYILSDGQKRRLALAGAIAAEPDILLLDEPFVGLDLEGERLLAALVSEYISNGKTVIVSTADDEHNI